MGENTQYVLLQDARIKVIEENAKIKLQPKYKQKNERKEIESEKKQYNVQYKGESSN